MTGGAGAAPPSLRPKPRSRPHARRVLVPFECAPPSDLHAAAARVHALGGETMGTTWSVKLTAPAATDPTRIRRTIDARLDAVVAQMSGWEPDSDLCRFNRAQPGSWHVLPGELAEVLRCALALAADSGGAYDPTVGALVDAWGFGPGPRRSAPPPDVVIAAARDSAGWRRLRLDAEAARAFQPGGVRLDLSGIAKGFAVDRVAEELNAMGLRNHLVEIGGELRGAGMKPDGQPWWVALELPPGAAASIGVETVVALHGLAVATSGDDRRHFEHAGRRYSHTLDPRSGWPVANGVRSVTVLHPSCMCADALATALTVLGARDGLDYARRNRIAALFLHRTADGLEETMSPEFSALLG